MSRSRDVANIDTILTTKGDIYAATAASTPARLGVGANDTILTADSSTATGLKWAAPAAGGKNFSLLNTGGTALSGAATITVSGISGKDVIFVVIQGASCTTSASIGIRFNSDSASNYAVYGSSVYGDASMTNNSIGNLSSSAAGVINLAAMSNNAGSVVSGGLILRGANASGVKVFSGNGGASPAGGAEQTINQLSGIWNNSATVTSVSIVSSGANFDAGTVFVYTSA
jgi:hypothetical protein